jgi:putative thioredoxin
MRQPNPGNLAASLAGAIDLSALRTPPPSATPAGAPPGEDSPYVVEVTEATFQAEVLQRSVQTPVVLDFWSPRAGGLPQVSAALQKLVAEGGGAWILARVDVDANPRVAALFRLTSVPFVVALVGGQPVDAFAENRSEAQLRPWLDAMLKAAGMPPGGGEPEVAVHPRLLEADDRLQANDLDGAEESFRALLAEVPADPDALAGLAQVQLIRRVDGKDPNAALAAAEAAPADVEAQLLAADFELLSGLADRAYARLIGVVRRSAGEDRDTARTRLIDLFALAAPDDPAVIKARRDLTAALF